jgi:hypothetical protein
MYGPDDRQNEEQDGAKSEQNCQTTVFGFRVSGRCAGWRKCGSAGFRVSTQSSHIPAPSNYRLPRFLLVFETAARKGQGMFDFRL